MLLKYSLAWLGMMVLAIVNGGIRDTLYKPRIGDLVAHQVSTAILLIVLTGYFAFLHKAWRIQSAQQAWTIGALWLVMTLLFEIGLGHFILRNPWSSVLHDYDLLAGRVWVLIPLWTLIGPYVMFRFVHANS